MNLKQAIEICIIGAKYNPHKSARVPAAIRMLGAWVAEIENLDIENISNHDWEEGLVADALTRELQQERKEVFPNVLS